MSIMLSEKSIGITNLERKDTLLICLYTYINAHIYVKFSAILTKKKIGRRRNEAVRNNK